MNQNVDTEDPTDHRLQSAIGLPGGASGDSGRLRLRTLVLVRWIAIAGQTAAILVVKYGLGYELPLALCLVAVGVSAFRTSTAGLEMLDNT